MPSRARRDIFADAKVILCRWHSDIIFAVYTREANITRQRRISLHSNTSRRKANITEKAIAKSNCFFMVEEGGFEPPKSTTTDLQSAPFGHSGTHPNI